MPRKPKNRGKVIVFLHKQSATNSRLSILVGILRSIPSKARRNLISLLRRRIESGRSRLARGPALLGGSLHKKKPNSKN
jgi:hypothetical protein